MATVVFGALGTLVGGPIGGAIGALLGREADRAILGTPTRDGPRLKELAVSSSSYGQPIARQFGAMRVAGTIVWATDLRETRGRSGGGKGQPVTTSYSYSVSLAVALSSRPIEGVGRIWADGNLLRGAAGDLKTGGTLRIHLGHADQPRDPLLAGALGEQCPAHRGMAYAVFEDLQLSDFGNRIPALSFEVFASGVGAALVPALISNEAVTEPISDAQPIEGFAQEGGSLAQVLELLGEAVPIVADTRTGGLRIGPPAGMMPVQLTEAVAAEDGEFGARTGLRHGRNGTAGATALRYYDSARDYQPGLQRASGGVPGDGERMLELPATLSAGGARILLEALRLRGSTAGERLQLRVAALDPAIGPGVPVAVAGEGVWRIDGWEWRSGGIELDLRRFSEAAVATGVADAGEPWRPADRLPAPTVFHAFELPWDGAGAPDAVRVHAALGAGDGRWAGAALHVERAGALVPLTEAGSARALTARLAAPLPASPAMLFEAGARLELICDDPGAELATIDGAALASGGNRLLVGEEIVQFMRAVALGSGRWRLEGLLRGRGGTEGEARAGHAAGTCAILLDGGLVLLDGAGFDPARERLAAIGAGDGDPVFTRVSAPGRSRRPLSPVHPRIKRLPAGGIALAWTRRARGSWAWADGVDTPLVEESERYEVGAGPTASPIASWLNDEAALTLDAAALSSLAAGTPLWVRQVGTYSRSSELALCILP